MQVIEVDADGVADSKFSPCGRYLATSGYRGRVRVWSLNPFEKIRDWQGDFGERLAWSADGKLLAQAGSPSRIWFLEDDSKSGAMPRFDPQGMAFSPAGDLAYHGSFGTQIYDLIEGRPNPQTWDFSETADKNCQPLGGITFSPDGSLIAALMLLPRPSSRSEYVIHSWEVGTGRLKNTYSTRAYKPISHALHFSPDGELIACLFGETICVWDAVSEKNVANLRVEKQFSDFVFTPDSRRLVSAGQDGIARFWNTRTWESDQLFDWHLGKLNGIDVAPDGLRFAAATGSGKVIVWDAD